MEIPVCYRTVTKELAGSTRNESNPAIPGINNMVPQVKISLQVSRCQVYYERSRIWSEGSPMFYFHK
ncbi:uncharacterized protein BYT42DRAFT_580305 [Radiomyces spectabilis]|uniref:uncharacterized protein n=1 Tax=Radiomyces spectabilis TaxID=64574 RepID=UPI002220D3A0|nr:uncharacterized protein BYT42DRAFT_580305 [Radiomyces spectabilis]KAI8371454.1 hypothetical protein BYT42DRAFT_580305 [Radiomyces spectabilis]